MPYCYRRRKKKHCRTGVKALIIALAFLILITFYFVKLVNPAVYSAAESKIKQLTYSAINDAISSVLSENIEYLDLTKVTYNSDGTIALIQVDNIKLNLISRATLVAANEFLEINGGEGVAIPLFTMSGIPLLSGRGPDIFIKVSPVASTDLNFYSDFTTSGINQTRHSVYFEITIDVKAQIPGKNREFSNTFTVPVAENIIIGKVPDIYLRGAESLI